MLRHLTEMPHRLHSAVIAPMLAMMILASPASAQNPDARISITGNNIGVVDALKEVQKQSGFSIGFNQSQLVNKAPVSLDLDNADLYTVRWRHAPTSYASSVSISPPARIRCR